jgi:orotidine-5'-phosphate decarboxylase
MTNSHFFETLQKRVEASESLLCIGLDPHVSQLSEPTADEAVSFCIKIIEETHQYAAAFKPNSAFFEAFGAKGFDALVKVMKVTFLFGEEDNYDCRQPQNLCERRYKESVQSYRYEEHHC